MLSQMHPAVYAAMRIVHFTMPGLLPRRGRLAAADYPSMVAETAPTAPRGRRPPLR